MKSDHLQQQQQQQRLFCVVPLDGKPVAADKVDDMALIKAPLSLV